jgi:hypothetical protein
MLTAFFSFCVRNPRGIIYHKTPCGTNFLFILNKLKKALYKFKNMTKFEKIVYSYFPGVTSDILVTCVSDPKHCQSNRLQERYGCPYA